MLAEFKEFSAQFRELKSGRLVFASHASHLSLKVCRNMEKLYQAQFRGKHPGLCLQDGTLTIQSLPLQDQDRSRTGWEPSGEICLNSAVPWEMEFRGGVSGMRADLRGLQISSLDILGDARQIELLLPLPAGASFVYIAGGISSAVIHRPAGVGMRLSIAGGVQELVFDDQHINTLGAETKLESRNFTKETGYCEICINCSARQVTILEKG